MLFDFLFETYGPLRLTASPLRALGSTAVTLHHIASHLRALGSTGVSARNRVAQIKQQLIL
jgi:hypothetical protein